MSGEAIFVAGGTLIFTVPDRVLAAGDSISVRWRSLRDGQGRLLAEAQAAAVAR